MMVPLTEATAPWDQLGISDGLRTKNKKKTNERSKKAIHERLQVPNA